MFESGADFDQTVSLNYTRLNLYGEVPLLLGDYAHVMSDPALKSSMLEFYGNFQKRTDYVEQLEQIWNDIVTKKEFFLYYNSLYWYVPLKEPFVHFTYNRIPLPGAH